MRALAGFLAQCVVTMKTSEGTVPNKSPKLLPVRALADRGTAAATGGGVI